MSGGGTAIEEPSPSPSPVQTLEDRSATLPSPKRKHADDATMHDRSERETCAFSLIELLAEFSEEILRLFSRISFGAPRMKKKFMLLNCCKKMEISSYYYIFYSARWG